jgi:hypothetical protein
MTSDDLKAVLDLIYRFGSKRAAIKAIREAEAKGRRGRPKGTQKYLETDLQALALEELLRFEPQLLPFENRKRAELGAPLLKMPKQRKRLVTQVLPMIGDPPKGSVALVPANVGKSKNAALARLRRSPSFTRLLIDKMRQNPDLAKLLPENIDALVSARESDPKAVPLSMMLMLFGAIDEQRRRSVKR